MGSIIHAFPDAASARLADKLLNRHSAKEIANAIDILVDVLDMLGGDPDSEDDDSDTAIDDGPCDEDTDREEEGGVEPAYGIDQGAGPDNLADSEDRALMIAHRDQVRLHRCKPYTDAFGERRFHLVEPAPRALTDLGLVFVDTFQP